MLLGHYASVLPIFLQIRSRTVAAMAPPAFQLVTSKSIIVAFSSDLSNVCTARLVGQPYTVSQLCGTHRAPPVKVVSDGIGVSRRNRLLSIGRRAQHQAIAMALKAESSAPETAVAEAPTNQRSPEPSIQRPANFDTIVLEALGKHKVTVVFLHGLGQSAERWAETITKFNHLHPGIKWILPTAPSMKVEIKNDPCNAWYYATPVSEEGHFIDLEGLDKSAERVAELLLSENAKSKRRRESEAGSRGFSQGCATAQYITRCSIVGKYSNGMPFPLKLDAAIALGGWMPTIETLEDEVNEAPDARQRAQNIPMFFGHCEDDNVMPVRQAHSAVSSFRNVGVMDITVRLYPEGGHACIPEEAEDLCAWMVTKFALDEVQKPESQSNLLDT